jgi:ComF family protein
LTYTILKLLFDFILPRHCIICKDKLHLHQETICDNCFSKIEIADKLRIEREFNKKFSSENLISDFASAFVFKEDGELQKLIHSLKYDNNFIVGKYLGKITAEILNDKIAKWNPDLIIPIPLHTLRKVDRGFNQANEISKGLSKSLNIPCSTKFLRRKIYTETQTHLNLVERKANMQGAFVVSSKKGIKNKNVILVDDVITTGATTSECAKVLLENGANKIFALSVAIAN